MACAKKHLKRSRGGRRGSRAWAAIGCARTLHTVGHPCELQVRALRAYGGLIKGGAHQRPRSAGREREAAEVAGLKQENPGGFHQGSCARCEEGARKAPVLSLGVVPEKGIRKVAANFQARRAASRDAIQKVQLLLLLFSSRICFQQSRSRYISI